MRYAHAVVAAVGSLLLAGCGGGGGGNDGAGGGDSSATALVQGTVVSRDGSTANLSGLFVQCPETGDFTMTDGSGSFDLAAPAGMPFSIEVSDPTMPPGAPAGGGCTETWDDANDLTDIDGHEVQFDEMLDEGEVCEIEIVVEDGDIVQAWIGDGENGHSAGEGVLFGDGVTGEIEVSGGEMCAKVEVEVDGFEGEHVLTVTLVSPEGAVEILGTVEVNADGAGHLSIHACVGTALPFGAASIADLAGFRIEVLDETGAVVLSGEVPFAEAGHWDDWWMDFDDEWFGSNDWLDLDSDWEMPDGMGADGATGTGQPATGGDCTAQN